MDTEVNETMYCLTYQKFWQQMAKMSRFLNGSLALGTLYLYLYPVKYKLAFVELLITPPFESNCTSRQLKID